MDAKEEVRELRAVATGLAAYHNGTDTKVQHHLSHVVKDAYPERFDLDA